MVEALAEIIAWATAETATTMTTEVQEIGAQQKEVGEAAAAADLVAAVARVPPAAAQAATMVAALRVTAVTKVVEVLLDHLVDSMRPLWTVENLVVVAVWLTARVAVMMSACAAVAVGLTTVGTAVVSAKVEVLARGVVVQAVGEVYKVTSLAALVVVLAVLVEDQMVAQVAVRGVATKLGLHNTMEWWEHGLRVMVKVAAKVKAQTPVVLVLTVGNVLNTRTHAAATDGIKTRLVATMSARVAVAVGLMVVGMVVVLGKVAVQLVHVVVQAVREVFKMTSLAALVVVLAVLVQDQMVAHVVLQVVTRMLDLPDTMDWWELGLRVTIKVGTKVKAQTPVVLVLTVGNLLNTATHAAATDGIKTRLVATMSARVAVAVGLTVVVMVVVLAKVAVQLVHVVVQAVGEVHKVTSLAALVAVLAVLVQDQVLAQVGLSVAAISPKLRKSLYWRAFFVLLVALVFLPLMVAMAVELDTEAIATNSLISWLARRHPPLESCLTRVLITEARPPPWDTLTIASRHSVQSDARAEMMGGAWETHSHTTFRVMRAEPVQKQMALVWGGAAFNTLSQWWRPGLPSQWAWISTQFL